MTTISDAFRAGELLQSAAAAAADERRRSVSFAVVSRASLARLSRSEREHDTE